MEKKLIMNVLINQVFDIYIRITTLLKCVYNKRIANLYDLMTAMQDNPYGGQVDQVKHSASLFSSGIATIDTWGGGEGDKPPTLCTLLVP